MSKTVLYGNIKYEDLEVGDRIILDNHTYYVTEKIIESSVNTLPTVRYEAELVEEYNLSDQYSHINPLRNIRIEKEYMYRPQQEKEISEEERQKFMELLLE